MPGYDGTGPMGMGPGTGWGRGPCRGEGPYSGPSGRWWGADEPWGPARGRGFGRGLGRGFRRGPGGFGRWAGRPAGPMWEAAPTREEEAGWLKGRADVLKAEMEAVQRRIEELAEEKGS